MVAAMIMMMMIVVVVEVVVFSNLPAETTHSSLVLSFPGLRRATAERLFAGGDGRGSIWPIIVAERGF